jgi:hypothetical protein
MRIRTGIVLGLLLTLGVAGCQRSAGTGRVATAGKGGNATSSAKPDGQTDQERMLKFAQCVRDNGVPDFADPQVSGGGGVSIGMPDGTDPKKADAAMQKCKQYMPNGGEPQKLDPKDLEKLRKLAQCMRDNGVTNFPDPTDHGIQVNGNTSGLDPNDPKFKAADEACARYRPTPPSGDPGARTETRRDG